MTTTCNDPETSMDHLLSELGGQGWLDQALTDADLDAIMARHPVAVTSTFKERALEAIQRAQQDRRVSPSTMFGNALSAARLMTGFDIEYVAHASALRAVTLESLERGHMPLERFLREYTPAAAARLLRMIKMNFSEFSRYLSGWAVQTGLGRGTLAGQPTFRQPHSKGGRLSREVAEYLAKVEDLIK